AIPFLQAAVEAGKRVLVHCHQGRSRSVSLVVAYLMATEHLSLDEALRAVQLARPIAQPNFSFMRQLRQFEE
ncbi:protein-tyrosine phosphatase-like protein, partial [Schizothecium vesticola]